MKKKGCEEMAYHKSLTGPREEKENWSQINQTENRGAFEEGCLLRGVSSKRAEDVRMWV